MIKKGVSPIISIPIYISLILAGIFLVVTLAQPIIENMKDQAAVDQAKNFLSDLGGKISAVAEAGEGSYTRVSMEF